MAGRALFVVAYNRLERRWEVRKVKKREHAESELVEVGQRGTLLFFWSHRRATVRKGAEIARKNEPSQLLVKNKSDGRFSEERTYPRSSDPAETPG